MEEAALSVHRRARVAEGSQEEAHRAAAAEDTADVDMGWYCGRRIKPHTIRLDLFNTEFMGFQIMKKSILVPAMMLASMAAVAQSSIDAYTLSQGELRGTARFMSMAGAFTALGGDISTLNQNPAGIGVYRGSDVGLTLDINMMNSKTSGISGAQS